MLFLWNRTKGTDLHEFSLSAVWRFKALTPAYDMLSCTLLFLLIERTIFVQAWRPIVTRIRLVNGSSPLEGRVEVEINGTFGTVCDKGFTDMTARVVCRSLNLSGGEAKGGGFFGPGKDPIYMDDLGCDGYEKWLGMCYFVTDYCPSCTQPTDNVNCDHNADVGVVCGPSKDGSGGVITQSVKRSAHVDSDVAQRAATTTRTSTTRTSTAPTPTTQTSTTPKDTTAKPTTQKSTIPTSTTPKNGVTFPLSAGATKGGTTDPVFLWGGVIVGLILFSLLLAAFWVLRGGPPPPTPPSRISSTSSDAGDSGSSESSDDNPQMRQPQSPQPKSPQFQRPQSQRTA